MPWGERKLKDGRHIPEIAWGSWTAGNGRAVTDQVVQAIDTGFTHVDTAQVYRNEQEVGTGLAESIEARKSIFLTTKWSGLWVGSDSIEKSCHDSLEKLGVKSVDLYLIHSPRLCNGDIVGCWKRMLQLKKDGYTKSVGVSNFKVEDLEEIRKAGLEMPVVNQILLHPYVYFKQAELLAYHEKLEIVTEAYSVLNPITREAGGPIEPVLARICAYRGTTPDQVLLAWARAKGAVVVTTSRSKFRLLGYLAAGDLRLLESEIIDIDTAGVRSRSLSTIRKRIIPALLCVVTVVGLEAARRVYI